MPVESSYLLGLSASTPSRGYNTEGKTKTQLSTASTQEETTKCLKLKRHIGLAHAIGIIVSSIVGSGIFITPQSVLQYAGSVGASLVIWALAGVYVFMQSWCYAELACIMPVAGGDYYYNYIIGGPALGFVIGWIHIVIYLPASCSAIAQTGGLYIATCVGLESHHALITLLAVMILSTLSTAMLSSHS